MYLKIMKLLLFLYTLCLYIVNTLNLDLLRSIISKFDNFCVYLEKKFLSNTWEKPSINYIIGRSDGTLEK